MAAAPAGTSQLRGPVTHPTSGITVMSDSTMLIATAAAPTVRPTRDGGVSTLSSSLIHHLNREMNLAFLAGRGEPPIEGSLLQLVHSMIKKRHPRRPLVQTRRVVRRR